MIIVFFRLQHTINPIDNNKNIIIDNIVMIIIIGNVIYSSSINGSVYFQLIFDNHNQLFV
ncbi:hypothetical protein DERP_004277 [Dermatophagoides pteronyssinus]|uniref:Uncharacterized protein n=1 Tax=Dermatophagoides pteronyssinus TaxID=6956 RepID=A0ABQ8J8Q6_DERPT|nr:hypothetical protein DERP_004277 [Dermatophagoides pteronyssinus]